MANKRQRKKQQTTKNVKALKQVGIKNPKQIKQLKNKPKVVNEIVRKQQRNITANERSSLIRGLGYKLKDHGSKRYWSATRWNEWYSKERSKQQKVVEREQRKQQRLLKDETDLYLLIFWKEKTDAYMDSQELIDMFKHEYKYVSVDYLIQSLNAFLYTQEAVPAMIGTTSVVIAKGRDRKAVKEFYMGYDDGTLAGWNEWGLVYEGKAVRYKELLIAIHAVIRLLYDNAEKGQFIGDLLNIKLPTVNPRMAKRLAKDLNWRGF